MNPERIKASCIAYYNQMHEQYLEDYRDELSKKPYDKDFLLRFIENIPFKGSVLDIGCGAAAQQARFLLSSGLKVTSIDLSEKCIETAKKNFTGIDFLRMDMTEMDFADESFDGIIAFYSIIHVPDEKLGTLFRRLNKILRINGKLAVSVHSGNFYGYHNAGEMAVFCRTYTPEELTGHLSGHGFKIVEINQRKPMYDFEFQSERIYLIAEKIKGLPAVEHKKHQVNL